MARVLEIEGETVDQALYKGLEAMQLSIDEVEMQVLDYGKKGFMGLGSKLARVRLTEREEAVVPDFVLNKDKPKEQKREKRERKEKRAPKKEYAQTEKISAEEYFGADAQFVENEVTEFLTGLISHVGVEGNVKAVEKDNGLLVNIEGDDMGMLIGRRGETLDAIQYLASLVYNKGKDDYRRVTVDTENYRKKRERTLIRLAEKTAAKAIKTGHRVSLEAMSPFERRIIHFALQDNDKVQTYSEGEEPNRHIVIDLKK